MTSPVEPGDLIADKYRVERVLGRGGMGVVVAAQHIHLGNRVAIKFLLPGIGLGPAIIARFEREARAAVSLHSEHVTRVLDVGRNQDDVPYMVMELLDGSDLAEELRARGRLPTDEAAIILIQACDAIAEAHSLGIVHRDIKPSNLFLARRPNRPPTLKVLDFGISKANTLVEGVSDITHTTDLIGSPLYMSPEQLRAPKTVGPASDIWSLGVTLYELVSGTPPFGGETMAELSANILMTPVVDVRERCVGLDMADALAAVLARCLAKAPEDRYATAEELAIALGPLARNEAPRETDVPAPAPAEAVASPPAPAAAVASPPARARMTLPILPGPAKKTLALPASDSARDLATDEPDERASPEASDPSEPAVSPVAQSRASAREVGPAPSALATSEAAVSLPPSNTLRAKRPRAVAVAVGLVAMIGVAGAWISTRGPARSELPAPGQAASVDVVNDPRPSASGATSAVVAPTVSHAAPSAAPVTTAARPARSALPAGVRPPATRSSSSAAAAASASVAIPRPSTSVRPGPSTSPLDMSLQ